MSRRFLAAATLTTAMILGGCSGGSDIAKSPEKRVATTTSGPEHAPSTTSSISLESPDELFFDKQLASDAGDGKVSLDVLMGACAGIQLHDSEGSFMSLVARPGYYQVHNPKTGKDVGALVAQDVRDGSLVHSQPMTFDSASHAPDYEPFSEMGDGGLIIPRISKGLGMVPVNINTNPDRDFSLVDGTPVMRVVALELLGSVGTKEFLESSAVIERCVQQITGVDESPQSENAILN